jgi:hypothetical protein
MSMIRNIFLIFTILLLIVSGIFSFVNRDNNFIEVEQQSIGLSTVWTQTGLPITGTNGGMTNSAFNHSAYGYVVYNTSWSLGTQSISNGPRFFFDTTSSSTDNQKIYFEWTGTQWDAKIEPGYDRTLYNVGANPKLLVHVNYTSSEFWFCLEGGSCTTAKSFTKTNSGYSAIQWRENGSLHTITQWSALAESNTISLTNLVSYWPFNATHNLTDYNRINNLTRYGSGYQWVSTPIDNGYKSTILSSTNVLIAPDTPSLSVTGNMTIGGIFKIDAKPTSATAKIIAKYNPRSYYLGLDHPAGGCGGNLTFIVSSSASSFVGAVACSNVSTPVGEWISVVAVFQPSVRQEIYINGVLSSYVASGTIPSSIADSTSNFSILASELGTESWLNGTTEEVFIYNRAWTSSEALAYESNRVSGSGLIGEIASPPSISSEYYFSNSGSDSNDCMTQETPCKTIIKLNTINLSAGSKVFFKRGDVWRLTSDGYIVFMGGNSTSNVTYGAYGTGNKPLFLGSYNVSSSGNWTTAGTNLWNTTFNIGNDVGNVIFNNEASVGVKRSTLGGLTGQGNYYYNPSTQRVTIYSTSAPSTFYSNIELVQKVHLANIENKNYIVIRDLEFSYGSAHGISARGQYQYIINNTLRYIGGSYHEGTARYGNAIEWGLFSNNTYAGYNYVTQVYDAGITHQSWDTGGAGVYIGNALVEYNIVTYSGYPYEYFNHNLSGALTENILIRNNFFGYSYEGWYKGQRHIYDMNIRLAVHPIGSKNFTIINNIMFNESYRFIENFPSGTWRGDLPIINNNLYWQGSSPMFTWNGTGYNTFSNFQSGTTFETNGAYADPQFITGTYTPSPGSPACTMSSTGSYVGALPCSGSSYYFSNSGSDSNDCLSSASACATLSKLQTISLTAGSKVYLDSCSIFRETYRGTYSNITYDSYGSCGNAKIYGSLNASSTGYWTNVGTNLWESQANFTGLEVFQIFTNTNLHYTSVGFGQRRTLQTNLSGQWDFYHNQTTDKIRVYSVGNPATVASGIELPVRNTTYSTLVYFSQVQNVTFQNIDVWYTIFYGLEDYRGNNNKFLDLGFYFTYGKGAWLEGDNALLNNSLFYRSAMRGSTEPLGQNAQGEAIWITQNTGTNITHNTVLKCGGVCINAFHTDRTNINYNVVKDPDQHLAYWSAGVYFDGCNNSVASYNNITGTNVGLQVGNEISGWSSWNVTFHHNIVRNARVSDFLIDSPLNTLQNFNINVHHNTFYKPLYYTGSGFGNQIFAKYVTNFTFKNNIVYNTYTDTGVGALLYLFNGPTGSSYGTGFISNYNVWYSQVGRNHFNINTTHYYSSFSTYRTALSQDANSLNIAPSLDINLRPVYGSSLCTASDTGGYIGALPCEEYYWEPFPMKNAWQKANNKIGGEGFQLAFDIDWSSANTSILYMTTDTMKVWKSYDGGLSWENIGQEMAPKGAISIMSDPNNANVVLSMMSKMFEAGTQPGPLEGIYLSRDGGHTWTQTGVYQNATRVHRGEAFLFDDTTFNGTQSTTIFAGSKEGLWKSTNGGNSWTLVNNMNGYEVYDLEWANSARTSIYVSTSTTFYTFNVATNTRTVAGSGLPGISYDVAVHPTNYSIVYSASTNGVYRSLDGGVTFSAYRSGLDTSKSYRSIKIGQDNPNIMYVAPNALGGNRPYRSSNGGSTWQAATTIHTDQFLFPNYYYASGIAVHPTNANIAVTQRDNSIARTEDGGVSWNYSSDGYIGARLQDIKFINQTTQLWCLIDYGLFLTTNNGDTFTNLNMPNPGSDRSCGSVDYNGTHIIASNGGWSSQNIYSSTNMGSSWNLLYTGSMGYRYIRFNPANNSIIYTDRQYSLNGGSTWNTVGDSYRIRALDPQNSSVIYGWKNVGSGISAVAKSTNHGSTWTQVGANIGTHDVKDMAVSPFNSNHIVVAGYRVFQWRGSSWVSGGTGLLSPATANYKTVSFDPAQPGIVWVGIEGYQYHGQGIFVSLDHGVTWRNEILNLGPYNDFTEIIVSPFDSTVYAVGPGIYTYGAQSITEDIIPPSPTQPVNEVTIAFIGDTGHDYYFGLALDVINKSEHNVSLIVHAGDLRPSPTYAYIDSFFAEIDSHLAGNNVPIIATLGNHDYDSIYYYDIWYNYSARLQQRIANSGKNITCTGVFGLNSTCIYNGIRIANMAPGWLGTSNGTNFNVDTAIQNSMSSATENWRICSAHLTQNTLQTYNKGDESGWNFINTCTKYGAIIQNAHSHLYSRTYSMNNLETKSGIRYNITHPQVNYNHTFQFVNSIDSRAGSQIETWSWMAKTFNETLTTGPVICTFNYQNNASLAYCRLITGQSGNAVLDEYWITNLYATGDYVPPVDPPPSGNCSYTSGNLTLDSSLGCTLTNINMGGNVLTVQGSGTTILRNVTNVRRYIVKDGARLVIS